ncbi:MAG: hypothetical protein ACOZQL_08745 [Myxococcota bacterium]
MNLRVIVAAAVLTSGCEKSKTAPAAEAATTPSKKELRATGNAEVEFFGTWSPGEVKAARVIFVAQAEPCVPVPDKPTRFGEEKMKAPGNLFAEFFIPQGTKGNACLYGLDDAGKVVGVANTTGNPMTFEGEGEVVKSNLSFTLQAP